MDPADEALLESWALSLHAKSPLTVGLYLREVRRFAGTLGKTPLIAATKVDVQKWIGDMQRAGAAGNTVRSRFYAVRAFYVWAHDEQEVDYNPTARITVPRPDPPPPATLSTEELAALFDACGGAGFRERRDLALLRMFAATGLRTAEMLRLELVDLDLAGRVAVIRKGKGGKPRAVRFDPETSAILDRYKRVRSRHRHAQHPRLWIGQRGPLTKAAPTDILNKRSRQARIGHVHPHQLRHTFADRFLEQGGTEGDLQELGGWESAEVMRRYGKHRAQERALGAYDRVDPMRGL